MMDFVRRKATVEDLELLRTLGIKTFRDTFAPHNTKENMDRYLQEKFNNQVLQAELANLNSEFYFVFQGDVPAGYMKLNKGDAQSENILPNSTELERIYVTKEFQGRGVGKYLLEAALSEAKRNGSTHIWLGVWEHNMNAIAFYERNHFEVFDKHKFWLGEDCQTDLLMKRSVLLLN